MHDSAVLMRPIGCKSNALTTTLARHSLVRAVDKTCILSVFDCTLNICTLLTYLQNQTSEPSAIKFVTDDYARDTKPSATGDITRQHIDI